MSPKIDLKEHAADSVLPEYYEHPDIGYLAYDPNTMFIMDTKPGDTGRINHPIKMVGKFFGTKQPYVPTCSEPSEGNRGCSKWYGCPFKKWKHVGPGNMIIKKLSTVSMAACYDFYETTRAGKPTSQMHLGLDGWVPDTSRTTIDILNRDWAVREGKLTAESSREAVMAVRPRKDQLEIGDLLPPWWGMMKAKGLPLPPTAEYFPELTEEEPAIKKRGRPRKQT